MDCARYMRAAKFSNRKIVDDLRPRISETLEFAMVDAAHFVRITIHDRCGRLGLLYTKCRSM